MSFNHTFCTRCLSCFLFCFFVVIQHTEKEHSETEKPWERPVNTRGGAYSGCSLSWTGRGSCSQAPLSNLPSHSSSTSTTGSRRPSGNRGQGSRRPAGLFIVILPGKGVRVCVCACVCVRERESEREIKRKRERETGETLRKEYNKNLWRYIFTVENFRIHCWY